MGFNKMLIYENYESVSLYSKNTYVGGDAYNYIINANYLTAYFALATFFAVIGMTFSQDSKMGEIPPGETFDATFTSDSFDYTFRKDGTYTIYVQSKGTTIDGIYKREVT